MRENTNKILKKLKEISKFKFIIDFRIIEKTKSILKVRFYFSEELFVQVYINTKRFKKSYALILNDRRIHGRDFVFNQWHLHPYESPDEHNESEIARKEITIEEFIIESFYIASEKLEII